MGFIALKNEFIYVAPPCSSIAVRCTADFLYYSCKTRQIDLIGPTIAHLIVFTIIIWAICSSPVLAIDKNCSVEHPNIKISAFCQRI